MIILKTLWDIIQSIFITILILYILYGICEFFDWVEYKMFEKDMNEYLKQNTIKNSQKGMITIYIYNT